MSWGLFVILLQRLERFEARDLLREITGPALTSPGEGAGQRMLAVREIVKAAEYD